MPSFFRNDEDVRIFVLGEKDTPEKKKKHARLLTVFQQCVRRPGTKGQFFFQRRSTCLGGAPILIFEPQGPIDRGIFQGGISRFGETLQGTFRCTAPGYIELEVKTNLSAANAVKFSRAIRKVIKQVAGVMQTGGDERVRIITPGEKSRLAKEKQAAKKKALAEAQDQRRAVQQRRKASRKPKPSRSVAPDSPAAIAKKKARRRAARNRATQAQRERQEVVADIEQHTAQSQQTHAAAQTEHQNVTHLLARLRTARMPIRALAQACAGLDPTQVRAMLETEHRRGTHPALAARLLEHVRDATPQTIAPIIARWEQEEARRTQALEAVVEDVTERAVALEKQAIRAEMALMDAREAAAQLQVEALQAHVQAALEQTSVDDVQLETLQAQLQHAERQQHNLGVQAQTLDVVRALRALRASLLRLERTEGVAAHSPAHRRQLFVEDMEMRRCLKRLARVLSNLETVGEATFIVENAWLALSDIRWARADIQAALLLVSSTR